MTAMDSIDEAVRKIIGAVETIAPKTWDMLVQSERLDAISSFSKGVMVLPIIGVVLAAVWRVTRSVAVPTRQEDYNQHDCALVTNSEFTVVRWIAGTLAALFVVWCLYGCFDAGLHYTYADVYAARRLMENVRCR